MGVMGVDRNAGCAGHDDAEQARVTLLGSGGYTDYNWWQAIHAKGAAFVTRLKRNVHRREVKGQAVHGQNIIAALPLKLGDKVPRGSAKNALYDKPLREIVVARAGRAE